MVEHSLLMDEFLKKKVFSIIELHDQLYDAGLNITMAPGCGESSMTIRECAYLVDQSNNNCLVHSHFSKSDLLTLIESTQQFFLVNVNIVQHSNK